MVAATLALALSVAAVVGTIVVIVFGAASYIAERGPFEWGMLIGRVAWLFVWYGFAAAFAACLAVTLVSFGLCLAAHPFVSRATGPTRQRAIYVAIFSTPLILAVGAYALAINAVVMFPVIVPTAGACLWLAWLFASVIYPAATQVSAIETGGGVRV